MGNARLDEPQAEIKIAGENINILYWYFWNIKICRWYHPYGRKQRGNKEPLDESEWEEAKSLLKTQNSRNENHGIWSHHFMANRFENNGNNDRLYFGGLKNYCRWWLKPCNQKMLTPWKKSYDQPRQHIQKQRYYFAHKGLSSQGYGFSSGHVWIWELHHIKRLSAKEFMFLNCGIGEDSRVPCTARRSNQSILKEINRECSLVGLMLKLKLQFFGHLMHRADLLERTLMLERLKVIKYWMTEHEIVGWHHQLDGHVWASSRS